MAAGTEAPASGGFDHLREHSIGLWQVLFQSITHMAPAAAVAYSIYISVPDAKQALRCGGLALIACLCASTASDNLRRSSSADLYAYARSLGGGRACSWRGSSSASGRCRTVSLLGSAGR